MKYVEILKGQVESYLTYLDQHDSAMPEAVQILEEKAAVAKEKYEKDCHKAEEVFQKAKAKKERLTAMRESIEKLSEQIRQKIVEYTKYTGEAQKNPNDSAELREKANACDREIQGKYAELLTLRKEYAENYALISDDPETTEDRLEKERSKAVKQSRDQRNNTAVLDLVPQMKMYDKMMTQRYLDLLPHVALDCQVLRKEDYSELLLLAALCTRRAEVAHCVPALGGAVSVVCKEKCKKICADLTDMQDELHNVWTEYAYREEMPKNFVFNFSNGNVSPQASSESSNGSKSYLLFSRDFLERLIVVLQENSDYDLFTLCNRLIEVGEETNSASERILLDRKAERDFQNDLKEFKRLYEETPEERLVTEQRYYQQKMLEEAQEKNRLLEQQMREERMRRQEEQREVERRYREEQEERARRERELERERDRERWREEEREKESKEEQRRAENERRREEADRQRREMSNTRHQCNTCANAGHCSSYMQRPNCAAYRPR